MEENITRDDLIQFGVVLLDQIKLIINENGTLSKDIPGIEWLKSKSVRKILDISAGSVQNLRTTQKVRFKKVLGSYYYNKEDLQKLFENEKDL